jgi:hypothetical protein
MLRALAVALLLSACTEATARGFFSTTSSPDSTWWAAAQACRFRDDSTAALRLAHGQRLDSLLTAVLRLSSDPLTALNPAPEGVLRVMSSDKKVVAYSFAVPLSSGDYAFFGQVHAQMGPITTLTPLTPSPTFDAFTEGDANHWPSGLIYSLQATTYRRTTRYHALMFRPHAQQAQQKWVEPWVFGRPLRGSSAGAECPPLPLYFGARVFALKDFAGEHFNSPPKRLLLRYAPEVSASMRFGKSGNEILVDEVAPMRHGRAGDFRTYGPTLAVDRLLFERGKWTLQPVENP